jgi:hypothetical protein
MLLILFIIQATQSFIADYLHPCVVVNLITNNHQKWMIG